MQSKEGLPFATVYIRNLTHSVAKFKSLFILSIIAAMKNEGLKLHKHTLQLPDYKKRKERAYV